jgi:hypothetical protein
MHAEEDNMAALISYRRIALMVAGLLTAFAQLM